MHETNFISFWYIQLSVGEIWLEEKLKPLSTNKYCSKDIFGFTEEIRNTDIESDHILAFYDVSALFTNDPLMETINILVDKAFEDDWFNETHSMQLQKHQLTELLEIATSNHCSNSTVNFLSKQMV